MSNRVVSILREFSPDIEVYSIDESFLRVETVDHLYGGATAMGHAMRRRIRQWTSLPVCAGFGESKTLAKFANHLAKKNPVFDGVCDLTALTDAQRQQWMEKIEVGEVWGVGRKIAARLQTMGIRSVLDLATADLKLIRRQFGVVLERTVHELQGISCLELDGLAAPRQQVMATRSFGTEVSSLAALREALPQMAELLAHHQSQQVADLHRLRHGRIWLADNLPVELSATRLRALLATGADPRYLLPPSVAQYIRQQGLYRPA